MARRSIEKMRKEEIINAFIKVISKKGLTGASIREIASIIGCNHGILRHYFGNKEGLIKDTLHFLMNNYIMMFEENADKHTSYIEQIKCLFQIYTFDVIGLELSRAWIEILIFSKTNSNIEKELRIFYSKIKSRIAVIIQEGIKAGEFKCVDSNVAANLILVNFEGMLFFSVVNKDNVPYKLMYEQLNQMYLNYLGV